MIRSICIVTLLLISLSTFGQSTDSAKEEVFYTEVPIMPQYPGGDDQIFEDFIKHSKLKITKRRNENTHALFVGVFIEKDGTCTFYKVHRGEGKKRIKEAKRLIKKMPKWSKGLLNNGEAARVSYTLPFWFAE